MNLAFDKTASENYSSPTQIARVLTESWVLNNMFCPRCGGLEVEHFPNNRPVADFFCPLCGNEFELKSKHGELGAKINDGAYDTMIQRITSNQNPDFFFMSYSRTTMQVINFVIIPKHFFVPSIIEKRKPLAETARRAGWTGCNILINNIPKQGKIEVVSNGIIHDRLSVVAQVGRSNALIMNNIEARGWLFDILNCVNKLPDDFFSLADVYAFTRQLSLKHPENKNVQPKIRQQLQVLRDRGIVEFLGNGQYRKTNGDK